MNTKGFVVGGFALMIVLALGIMFPRATQTIVDRVDNLGASAGPEHTEREYFNGGLTYGEGCFSTSTTGTLNGSMLKNGCIYITATGAGQAVLSLTLPASSTMTMIPRAGNCTEWFVDNSDVAQATTTTLVAGAGHDIVGLDATGAGTGADVIDGLEFAQFKSCRQKDGDIVTFAQEYIHAD